jgi:hypothetical protein
MLRKTITMKTILLITSLFFITTGALAQNTQASTNTILPMSTSDQLFLLFQGEDSSLTLQMQRYHVIDISDTVAIKKAEEDINATLGRMDILNKMLGIITSKK